MQSFRLRGIKGFVDTGDIELRPITVVIGQNSSGKSSILRFPLVLKQTFLDDSMAPLLFYGKSIDYGNYEDVVFNHDKQRPVDFSVTIPFAELDAFPEFHRFQVALDEPSNEEDVTVSAKVSYRDNSVVVDAFTVYRGTNQARPLMIVRNRGNSNYTMEYVGGGIESEVSERFGFDKFMPDFRMFRVFERENRVLDAFYYLLSAINGWFNVFANNVQYIGPFRRTPERSHRYKENAVTYVGSDGEFAPVILGQDRRTGSRLIGEVSHWLTDNLGFSLEVEDLRGDMFRVMITDQATKAKNNLIDVGHGLSQLIPIVVQTFMNNRYRRRHPRSPMRRPILSTELNIIEQPELHLHPAAQACLADLFVSGIQQDRRSPKAFLIETHSEHMLIRLRRYVVEQIINPDDIALYYTEKKAGEGSVQVHRLDIDQLGNISNWPEGFFSEDYEEVRKLRKAIRSKELPKGDNPLW